MELRIDPNFPPAFERLRKGFRKKAGHVRDALARAVRSGRGLPQQDKLTLAWKQHKRAVFWVRVDRAIRLIFEQDGDVQTLLYVGRHQDAEAFLRNLPKKAAPGETIPVSEWLQRTAAPVVKKAKTEKEPRPTTTASAQRRLIESLESLMADCLLQIGPEVVEEYAAPHVLELEQRLAELKSKVADLTRDEQQDRERLQQRWEDFGERVRRLDKTLHTHQAALDRLADETAALGASLSEAMEELRRQFSVANEESRRDFQRDMAALREEQARGAADWLRQLEDVEVRLAEMSRTTSELGGELRARLNEAVGERRNAIEAAAERQRRERDELRRAIADQLSSVNENLMQHDGRLDDLRQRHDDLIQRLTNLEHHISQNGQRQGIFGVLGRLWQRGDKIAETR